MLQKLHFIVDKRSTVLDIPFEERNMWIGNVKQEIYLRTKLFLGLLTGAGRKHNFIFFFGGFDGLSPEKSNDQK